MKTYKRWVSIMVFLFIFACEGATGNTLAIDPIERGLSYIAAAIVTFGVLRLFSR